MIYRCIRSFYVDKCDDDGFTVENEYLVVEAGTIWQASRENLIGGEIHLDMIDGSQWVEISFQMFLDHFVCEEG